MNPTTIIKESMADGVLLKLSNGLLKATGDPAQVDKWLPAIREHKPGIIAALSGSMSAQDEVLILRWLASIEETDPAIIDYVLSTCRSDTDALDYFLGRAGARQESAT